MDIHALESTLQGSPLLSELPPDVLSRVLAALHSPKDVASAGASCRALLAGTRADALWERLCYRSFPPDGLRKVHLRCFRGRGVADPFVHDPPRSVLTTLQCWRQDALADRRTQGDQGADSNWCCIFRALALWPFPTKVVRFGADTTPLLYMFECPAEGVDLGAGGVYNLFARTSGQTNHIHKGRWMWVPGAVPRTWRLSPAGSTGRNDKSALFSKAYTQLTVTSGRTGGTGAGTTSSGAVPFHSNIPPLWRQVVDKDTMELELGHSKKA